jgi:beta-glucosidase
MAFPKDFLWGSATSSYQIEGAALQDGRSECIWTRFCNTPGKVHGGNTGDVACDHYHLFKDDVKLMQDMGLHAYRFSTAWPRILPQGTGKVNEKGLAFYDQLVDTLLAANIEPYLTLYHWDLPQVLQDKGGWENPEIIDWFVEYTDVLTKRLGDRVTNWITHNEPWVFTFVGYAFGAHAPGLTDNAAAYRAAHNALLSHGKAVPIIRQNVPNAKVGITIAIPEFQPETDSAEDAAAVERQRDFHPRWFLDPLFKGTYPAELAAMVSQMDDVNLDGIEQAKVEMDFLGVNHYSRFIIKHDESNPPGNMSHVTIPDVERTTMDWEVYPQGMYNVLKQTYADYAPKEIYITENGAAFVDPAPENGVVDDPKRTSYLREYFKMAQKAIEDGVPLKGYFVWSFLDNFEWAHGYTQRFGIINVDFETLKRTPKASANWYKKVIAANAVIEE